MAERESRLGELSGELESARSDREQAEQSVMAQRAEVERLQRELGELTAARDEPGSGAVSGRGASVRSWRASWPSVRVAWEN